MRSSRIALTGALAFAVAVFTGCASGGAATKPAGVAPSGNSSASLMPEFVVPNTRNSPFSGVVRVGNMLYVSGQIGTDSTGHLPAGGIGPETTEAMKHISKLLVQAGSSLEHVAKCTVMLSDMSQWNAMNEAYVAFFPNRRPARSSFGATALAQGAHVEIECIATA
jgi:reactive intermediate/imine deaminase